MAPVDVWLQSCVKGILPYLAVSFIIIKVCKRHGRKLYDKIMARILIIMGTGYSKKMRKYKQRLFAELHDLAQAAKSQSQKLNVVEIGAGGGSNFRFFPENITVKCVDPNPNFASFLKEAGKEYPHIEFEFCQGVAEDMSQIESNSVDAVVATCVLCSVSNVNECIFEVKRILKPVCN